MPTYTGTNDSEIWIGTSGDDSIFGRGGDDSLSGAEGNDWLQGGTGNDSLTGGSGNDTFIFQIGDGSDTIMDLTAGDIVEVTRYSTFQSIQTIDSDIVVALSDTDQLVFPNTDYSTVLAALHFSPLILYGTPAKETLTGGSGDDTIYGLGSLDTIYGNEGNDTLVGGDTFDILYGGTGNNFLYGEGGNDTLVVDSVGDNYLDGGSETPGYSSYGPTADLVRFDVGNIDLTVDLRISGPQDTGVGLDTFVDIEHLAGSSGNDVLIGDGQNNELYGNAGSDTLIGGAGDDWLDGYDGPYIYDVDVLDGGPGNDSIFGDPGDFASYADATASVRVTAGGTGPQNTGGAGIDYVGCQNLIGSDFGDQLSGNQYANALVGGAGNDVLYGGAGSDTLDGGDGIDTARYDDFNYGGVSVDLRITGPQDTGAGGIDTLANIENLRGSGWNDHLIGNEVSNSLTGGYGSDVLDGGGAADHLFGDDGNDNLSGGDGNDILNGGAGDDTMAGGTGNDTFLVDSVADTITENAGEGNDVVISTVGWTLGANVERLSLLGSANLDGTGNGDANIMVGNIGANQLSGLDGNDFLSGLAGNDTLIGGAGADILNGGAGSDSMSGGAGNDYYTVDNVGDLVIENGGEGTDVVNSNIGWTLGSNVERLVLRGTADIHGTGNGDANIITGNSGGNQLSGLGGNDTLNGASGNDTLLGGAGADLLSGGVGNDWLEGGADRDDMTGGTGADSFVFRDGDFSGTTFATADIIRDFSSAQGDHINLGFVDANSANGTGTNEAFAFIGTAAFSHTAGELRYEQVSGFTYVYGDTNGDGAADFMMRLDGLHALSGGDFVL